LSRYGSDRHEQGDMYHASKRNQGRAAIVRLEGRLTAMLKRLIYPSFGGQHQAKTRS